MRIFKHVQLIFINIFLFIFSVAAQPEKINNTGLDSAGIKYVSMPAGSQFAASHWKEFWWGKHWRKEWGTPVRFSLLDLDTTKGGLTPLKRGGGHETKTLRLKGADGKEYVLRTIDKSLDVLIPEAFKGSFINDLVNDQISTAHPFGPLVIADLSAAIGILHTNPVIIFLPPDPRLGIFSTDFANKLCLFEERPSGDGWDNTSLTGFADNIINSEKLFIKLAAANSSSVDQKEFLKVRLLDMLVNDWDRHEDQWVWAAQKKNGKIIYRPFARDRDQAFSKTDGVSLYLLSRPWALRSIQNMDKEVKDVIGTNLSATMLDRKFTNALSESDWKNIIVNVQYLLPDSVILQSLQKMPGEIYNSSGNFLYERLCARRNDMLRSGLKYYKKLNKEVTITGTDQPEIFTINKTGHNTTIVTAQALNELRQPADTLYYKIFDHVVTHEINIYGAGGNDQFVYAGKTKNRILVRTIGGNGTDTYSENNLIESQGKRTIIYDSPDEKPAAYSNYQYKATTDTSLTNYNSKSFKYDWWIPLFTPGYNPDDGFVTGAAFTYRKRQWHKNPFGWQQSFAAGYAAATSAYSLHYKGIFKHAIGKWDINTAADYNAPAYVLNFYGFGNATKLDIHKKTYYQVRATGINLNTGISRAWKKNEVTAGLLFNTVKVEPANNKYISQLNTLTDTSVFSTKYFAGAAFNYMFNNADDTRYPAKGINYYAGIKWIANLKEKSSNFATLQSSFTFYYSPFKNITVAHRTGGATNIGNYEFYQANTIGGHENLRGYWRTRFAGQTSFYQNTDLRWKLMDLKGYVLRGSLGIYAFFDDGRVWIKNDHTNKLHTGYGGGVYFIPYNKFALNISYGSSEEVNVLTVRTGFLF
jgi:hypothetical protein